MNCGKCRSCLNALGVVNPIEHRMAALLASPYASLWRTAGSWEWLTANEIWSVR